MGIREGSIVAWGSYSWALPSPNSGFVKVVGGWQMCAGLKADGSVVRWAAGPLAPPVPNTGIVDIACDDFSNFVVLYADGHTTLQCFAGTDYRALGAGGASNLYAIRGAPTVAVALADAPFLDTFMAAPNPFTSSTKLLGRAGPVTIHDATGRMLRELDGFVWDGRDASGLGVPRGIYFATNGDRTVRLVKLGR
jgi:hypothetical protein